MTNCNIESVNFRVFECKFLSLTYIWRAHENHEVQHAQFIQILYKMAFRSSQRTSSFFRWCCTGK